MPFTWQKENLAEMAECNIPRGAQQLAFRFFSIALKKRREALQLGTRVDYPEFFKLVLIDAIALATDEMKRAVQMVNMTYIGMYDKVVHALHHIATDSVVQTRYDASKAAFEAAMEELINS